MKIRLLGCTVRSLCNKCSNNCNWKMAVVEIISIDSVHIKIRLNNETARIENNKSLYVSAKLEEYKKRLCE